MALESFLILMNWEFSEMKFKALFETVGNLKRLNNFNGWNLKVIAMFSFQKFEELKFWKC